ncbi:unnamed protein product [Ostreobium quekettii]|uniref:Coenzyme Q-binding protein COQ10 START domain-containing protein n=1 Tax=Ostreobium quekettii TaxID=121088 RepID=A0A8S1JEA8_9CHLO|nr:unnamed protein product [Ostreobium quekettii]|eukprot:evm.model.scf_128EXC.10 EVM.evm.TU.scf_128EXC.10   scf_128EXC:87558-88370(-)
MPNEGAIQNGRIEQASEASGPVDLTVGEWHDPEDDASRVVASEKDGFLCHISLRRRWAIEPSAVFRILTNPDNSKIFRDIYSVPYRKVLEDDGQGRQVVEVEQASGFKFLIIPILFRTRLIVEQDEQALTMSFRLARRGTMKEFRGVWTLVPAYEEGPGGERRASGTIATMEQDVLPAFVPPFFARVLRGISVNACRRVVQDVDEVVERVRAGEALQDLLDRGIKGVPRAAAGGKTGVADGAGNVASFPVAAGDTCTSEEEDSPRVGTTG